MKSAGGEKCSCRPINLLNIWNQEELPINGQSLLLYHFTRRMIKVTIVIIMGYHC
jgi:hypothetical protein